MCTINTCVYPHIRAHVRGWTSDSTVNTVVVSSCSQGEKTRWRGKQFRTEDGWRWKRLAQLYFHRCSLAILLHRTKITFSFLLAWEDEFPCCNQVDYKDPQGQCEKQAAPPNHGLSKWRFLHPSYLSYHWTQGSKRVASFPTGDWNHSPISPVNHKRLVTNEKQTLVLGATAPDPTCAQIRPLRTSLAHSLSTTCTRKCSGSALGKVSGETKGR